MAKKEKKPKSKARKIIEWILFGVFGVLGAFVLAANISSMVTKKENYGQSIRFGMGTFVILTSSMEPDIKQGTMIITMKEDVSKFQERLDRNENVDLTFANVYVDIPYTPEDTTLTNPVVSNQVMTHRLREVHVNPEVEYGKGRYYFITAGINHEGDYAKKEQYQIFTEAQYLGTVKVVSSFLGNVMSFVSSPLGLIVILLIPAGYLIVVSAKDIFKAVKESEEAEESETPKNNDGGDHLSKISKADRERLKNELLEEMIKSKKEAKKND